MRRRSLSVSAVAFRAEAAILYPFLSAQHILADSSGNHPEVTRPTVPARRTMLKRDDRGGRILLENVADEPLV